MNINKFTKSAVAACLGLALPAAGYNSGRAGFSTVYHGRISPYRINSVFLLPGETLEIQLPVGDSASDQRFDFRFSGGLGGPSGPHRWTWVAPENSGLNRLALTATGSGDSVIFQAFVMVPASEQKGEYLQGYRIGRYPKQPLKGSAFYLPPQGFVRVDSALSGVFISPHFRLGQFRCKQSPATTAFLVLKEDLPLRLEAILERANAGGIRCSTLHVMSGYRTPYYNRLIGNVKYSAHQWGAAADVFVDPAGLGEMADLNSDGRRDGGDSKFLSALADHLGCGTETHACGGLGSYPRTGSHGPFVHLDVRPSQARW